MRYPLNFTRLGFLFNSLLDSGEFLDLEETHIKIEEKQLFPWLQKLFKDRMDIGIYSKVEIDQLEEFFCGLSECIDEEKKMGVRNNGISLLVAYSLEAIQQNPEGVM